MLTTILVNFNHGHYLAESLEGLLRQTRRADEFIVIDDASTDNSVEIVSSFLPRHPNARLVRNPVNQGVVKNMNDGLRISRGTIIHFAAADDLFYPTLYEKGMSLLTAHPGAGFFSACSDLIDAAGRNLDAPMPALGFSSRQPEFLTPDAVRPLLLSHDGWFMGNTALFRRDCLIDEGGFPEELLSYADGYMCRLLALKYGACFSPELLAGWRRLDDGFSSTLTRSPDKVLALILAVAQKMQDANTIFPAEYVKRWKGRAEFGVKRQALARGRAHSSGAGGRIAASVREKFLLAALVLKLRPWDIAGIMRGRFGLR